MSRQRSRRLGVGLTALVLCACAVLWVRIRIPTQRAAEFADVINSGEFRRAGEMLQPPDQSLPGRWADPSHWGDDGSFGVTADVAPLRFSQIVRGVRYVSVTLILDAESPNSTLQHTFEVTSASLRRLPKTPDAVHYPVKLRTLASSDATPEIPSDVAAVPARDIRLAGAPKKRYFLIGNVGAPAPGGRPLLVVMPGGTGGADFSPFIRRIYQRALSEEWLVAQIVAPVWDRRQARTLVWPRRAESHPSAAFTSEELFDDVVDDVASRAVIDASRSTYSPGPPAGLQHTPSRFARNPHLPAS